MTQYDPYLILTRIDTQMRYHANDPERFSELCIRREVIVGAMEAIANSVARFLRAGGLA